MNGATFPHSADYYKVLYGIELFDNGKWALLPMATEHFGPVSVRALPERKDRDEILKEFQKQYPKTIYRKATIHVACNVIPERDTAEIGTAETERRAAD